MNRNGDVADSGSCRRSSKTCSRGRSAPPWTPTGATPRVLGFIIFMIVSCAMALPLLSGESSPTQIYTLDPAPSFITFDCEADLHDFSGKGTGLSGSVNFDPSQGSQKLAGKVDLKVASLNTGDEDRDADLRKDVLPVKKHPLISFFPLEVTSSAPVGKGGSADLRGTMTLNDVSREMTLKVTLAWPKPGTLRVTGSQKLKLTDFKIDPPGAIWPMRVHDEMTFQIDLTFKRP